MLTQKKAEELATKKIQEYVNTCDCGTNEDVGNVLMKLLSVTGQALLATQGQEKAVRIMQGTTNHIAKPKFKSDWHRATMQ